MSGSNGASVSFPSPGKLETFLSGLPPEALKVLLDISYPVGYPEHALVISEDQPCQAVFMLHSGRAKLSTKSRDGKRVMLRIASPGEILGLSSVLLGVGYDITAETLARSVVRVTKREDFLDFVLSYSLLAPLASEYQAALDSLRSLAWFPTATARVAQLLLHMCEERKDSEAK